MFKGERLSKVSWCIRRGLGLWSWWVLRVGGLEGSIVQSPGLRVCGSGVGGLDS